MAARERERGGRIEFLWRASHQYSTLCPQLAAFWGSKILDLAGPERLCPDCGSLLLPSPSPSVRTSVRMVSRRRLKEMRRKRRVAWLTSPLPRARSYVVVRCRCGGSFVAAALEGRPRPAVSTETTPLSARRRKKRLSATLKSMLETSSRQQAQRQRQQTSPSLSLFLTALNS